MSHPILPRFEELQGKRFADPDSLAALAKLGHATASVDQVQRIIRAALREEIDNFDAEQAIRELHATDERPVLPARRVGRPIDMHRRFEGLQIWMEFQIATLLTNMRCPERVRTGKNAVREPRLFFAEALHYMERTRNIAKRALYRRRIKSPVSNDEDLPRDEG